jgi:hypothetical protein
MNVLTKLVALVALLFAMMPAAWAHGNYRCDVPKEEMRPQMELQKKLKAEGWKVRMIQIENGCYEVYGFDAAKQRVEAFFDPKTFQRLDAAQ